MDILCRILKGNAYFAPKPVLCFVFSIMKVSSRSLVSSAMMIELISVVVAIAVMLLAPNITIINAQQLTNQPPAVAQNGVTFFQSTEEGFRLQVPQGWIIHDVNNTGSTLSEESTQGYGILAQLCPQEEEGQEQEQAAAAAPSNVSSSANTTATSCQGSEGDVIHIVRYPDLDARLQGVVSNNVTNVTTATTTNNNNNLTIDNILSYHMQKLEQVGYNRIEIVVNIDTTLNVTNAQTNQTIATVPAKFVEMTYNTASAPNETRHGYFILTATNATHPNLGMTKGYSVFYEGSSGSSTETTTRSGSLTSRSLVAPAREVFDSFELVAVRIPTEQPLIVEIMSNDTEGGDSTAPTTFEFEADVAGGTTPYAYSWDFDDDGEGSSAGGESTEQTISHTFDEAGSYDVVLTVTDSTGQSASDSMEITVEEEEEEVPPLAEEEEEEEVPPLAEEEEEEEEEVPPAEGVQESIEDEVDSFVDELLDRFGVDN
jgi:PKD repeat protein